METIKDLVDCFHKHFWIHKAVILRVKKSNILALKLIMQYYNNDMLL